MDTGQFDSSYTAVYYPWVKYFDEVNNKDVWLPPSITAFGAYAYNDRIAQPWFAPAGFNRAAVNAKDIKDKTTYLERNDLYNKNINPIAKFPSEGIVVWGQKTLQVKTSALSSVNVRRLMIFLRKTIASASRFLVFEPNVATTWERFVKLVRPILDDVFLKYGIEKYKIEFDETTNTPEMIAERKMGGRIFVIPTRAAEIIQLDFVISPTGADFSA
jgi:phage tail sheath protein FI